jgi:GR25 family glycosyltransferase involved in LPS biosynthesis
MNIKYYVRSLPNSPRRASIGSEALKLWDNFEFWDNIDKNSEIFKEIVASGKVVIHDNYVPVMGKLSGKKFSEDKSDILGEGQVANFISMMMLFEKMSKDKEDAFLVSEDDIVVQNSAKRILKKRIESLTDGSRLSSFENFIIGIGWGKNKVNAVDFARHPDFAYMLRPSVFRYCNPCFLIDKKAVNAVLKEYNKIKIETPCDVWLHNISRTTIPSINRYVLYPALVSELSYSGKIDSEINPKRIRFEVLREEGKYAEADKKEKEYLDYSETKRKIWRDKYGI